MQRYRRRNCNYVEMHVMDALKKLLGKQAYASQIKSGKQAVGSIVKEQGNNRAQMEYYNRLNYVSIPEIATLKKRVEMCRLDVGKNTPRFSCLRLELLSLEGPTAGVPLFQALIPVTRDINHGVVEALMRPVHKALGNKAVIANIVRAPVVYLHQVCSATYTAGTVKILMDGFTTKAALVASNSAFDWDTMHVQSEFVALPTFAEEMAEELQLDYLNEEEIGHDGMDIMGGESAELLANMEREEDLSFGPKDASFGTREGPSYDLDSQDQQGLAHNVR